MRKPKKPGQIPLFFIVGILVLGYLTFLTGRSIYQNWQTNQEIKRLNTDLEALRIESQNLRELIVYYQTQSFKEKEARQKLGLVKPDEKVVIITHEPVPNKVANENLSRQVKKPNYWLWWRFFTEKGNLAS